MIWHQSLSVQNISIQYHNELFVYESGKSFILFNVAANRKEALHALVLETGITRGKCEHRRREGQGGEIQSETERKSALLISILIQDLMCEL